MRLRWERPTLTLRVNSFYPLTHSSGSALNLLGEDVLLEKELIMMYLFPPPSHRPTIPPTHHPTNAPSHHSTIASSHNLIISPSAGASGRSRATVVSSSTRALRAASSCCTERTGGAIYSRIASCARYIRAVKDSHAWYILTRPV